MPNPHLYYSSVLWRAVGFSEKDSLTITVITGAVNIITTLIAIAFVDKFGRKPLLILGSISMTLTLGTMAYLFGNAPLDVAGNPNLTGSAGTLALIAANLYVFCFGFSWGPVVWVLLGEIIIKSERLHFQLLLQCNGLRISSFPQHFLPY